MKSHHKNMGNRHGFEQLENRQLLAGNVTTALNGDQLVITGDGSANVLLITQTAPNTFKLTGGGTKVDGQNSETISGVTNMFIDMGGGSDALTIKGVTLTGNTGEISLGILLGDGSDALVMSGVTTYDACGINGGSGNNAIVIDKSSFGYDLGIQTYGGVDAITITRSTVYGALSIQMGDGTNALSMVSDNVTKIESGGAPCSYGLPEGFDVLENAFFEIDCGAEIDGGNGVDAIAMVNVQIDCLTEIYTYGGVDSVTITNSRFGDAPIVKEAVTPDTPVKKEIEFSGLCIETGCGNDAVVINATTVYGFLQIDTSGDIECPTDVLCCDSAEPVTAQTESSGNDGIDAVVLNNVKVLQSEEGLCITEWCDSTYGNQIQPAETGGWCCCICDLGVLESGMLLIYTGNQTDSVTLNKVITDAETVIYTTDESSQDSADAVAITNSSFNQNNEVMRFSVLPLIETCVGLYVETGNGNDAVAIVKTKVVGEADVETDCGTDAVAINSLVADELFVDLGSGNYDTLTVAKSTVSEEEFQGGGDTGDTLVYKHLGNNFANPPAISGFQYVL